MADVSRLPEANALLSRLGLCVAEDYERNKYVVRDIKNGGVAFEFSHPELMGAMAMSSNGVENLLREKIGKWLTEQPGEANGGR